MNTQCKQSEIQFQDLYGRKVIVKNDGERSSSDGGLLLLQEIKTQRNIIKRFTECFFFQFFQINIVDIKVQNVAGSGITGLQFELVKNTFSDLRFHN